MNLSKAIIIVLSSASALLAQDLTAGVSGTTVILQGGDNIATAYPIPYAPFDDSGTTVGHTDDYHGNCGSDNGAPDIVYSYIPASFEILTIALCQSSNYDTRLYIFDGSPSNVIACNDDYCSNQYSDFVSALNCIEFLPGHTYYIVVDGYGTASGQYSIDINYPVPGVSISGLVSDTSGNPIVGAGIRILSEENPVWSDTTDFQGRYYAFGLSDGYYTVEASKPGFFTQVQGPVQVLTCDPAFVDFILQSDQPPCDIVAHPGEIVEDEPICYDDFDDIYNIGCSAIIWDTIPANCVFFGSSGTYLIDGLENRDTDWLEFDVADSSTVSLVGMAEFDILLLIIKQGSTIPCEGFVIVDNVSSQECTEFSLDLEIGAGRYWVWVGPSEFTGVSCGLNYQFSLITMPHGHCDYVVGDVNQSGTLNGIDIVYAVNYFKGYAAPLYSCYCDEHIWNVAGDVNADCIFNGIDVSYAVSYLKGGSAPAPCPECPPAAR
jgi:hypothetical protein